MHGFEGRRLMPLRVAELEGLPLAQPLRGAFNGAGQGLFTLAQLGGTGHQGAERAGEAKGIALPGIAAQQGVAADRGRVRGLAIGALEQQMRLASAGRGGDRLTIESDNAPISVDQRGFCLASPATLVRPGADEALDHQAG